ncbi:MAG: hypothetical protein KatS3mg111_1250 [Pirellulaceae bacterium]|nr:MAG: hypothetical protein KatS3mg111_1250 [Pirellulaceae bacterium]
MRHASMLVTLAMLVAAPRYSQAIDWPQWQGPERNAISREEGLLQQWPDNGPPEAWRATGIGRGMGGVAVADGRIYTTGDIDGTAWLFALNEANGELIWQAKIGRGGEVGRIFTPAGPRATPTVDEDRVYILSQHGDLVCFSTDGQEVWRINLVQDHGGIVPTWGYSESPLVDGEKLICTPGAPDGTLLAVNKMTGQTIWKSDVPAAVERSSQQGDFGRRRRRGNVGRGQESGASYSSAIVVDFANHRQYVQLTATTLAGFSAEDGTLLWRYDPVAAQISCSTPIYHDGYVFASSAYDGGGGLVKLSTNANGHVEADEVYFTTYMRNHHGGLILHDGCVYGAAGGNEGGFLVTMDFLTGDILWRERRAPKGSLAFADGRLYLRAEGGTMILIEPNREQYIERGRFEQPDRSEEPAWTHPVIANGKLYLRDQDLLLCYDIAAQGDEASEAGN